MKPIRQILVHLTDSPRAGTLLALGAQLAAAHQAQLAAVYAVDPSPPGAYLSPETSAIAVRMAQEADDERRALVQSRVAEAGAALGLAIPLALPGGDAHEALREASNTADLLLSGQFEPEQPGGVGAGLAGRLVVSAGCPLLFVPYILGERRPPHTAPRCGQSVLVAWSGRREGARALRDALPLLQQAERVEVLQIAPGEPEPGAPPQRLDAVLQHLARHGVQATGSVRHGRPPSVLERMQRAWVPDAPVAEALLSQVADSGADLLVCGGYGHPRAWELALGGVTRTLLQSMTVPVLMAH
jgi:nucleotide-binding universal stress UspA family protein